MTAQYPDHFIFNNKKYDLAAYSAQEPFNPAQIGFEPVAVSTACWRGYISEYSLNADENLILKHFSIGLFEVTGEEWKSIRGKPINGILPTKPQEDYLDFLNNRYENVNLSLNYTGGILIADGFVEELYIHMGFHPAWKYQEVHELTFEEGKLMSAKDKSSDMAKLRKSLVGKDSFPDMGAEHEKIMTWIERTFDRKY